MQLDKQFSLNMAFVLAASEGRIGIFHELLKAGADIHFLKDAALIQAAANGHVKAVDWLLVMGADQQNQRALIVAAQNGHNEIVKILVERADRLISPRNPSPI